jgi:amino-acid N-acetyltransferase
MKIRDAKVTDAAEIHSIISDFAELDRMLFRPIASIYENIQTFIVAEDKTGRIIGCAAMSVLWADLAEVKSLAVKREAAGKGIGKMLVREAVRKASSLGISRIFALTLEPAFFEKIGFKRIDKKNLPMKVWSDCANCPKQDHCDETAFILDIQETEL